MHERSASCFDDRQITQREDDEMHRRKDLNASAVEAHGTDAGLLPLDRHVRVTGRRDRHLSQIRFA